MTLAEIASFGGRELTEVDPLQRFTDDWLHNRRLSDRTRDAYRHDVNHWLAWCVGHGLHPLEARFTHVNAYARELETEPNPTTGNPLAPTSVARRLSAVSSWYKFLVKLGAIASNPATDADRPKVDHDQSPTVGLSKAEAVALLTAAQDDGLRTHALMAVLVGLGIRVAEACGADVADLGHADGHRVLIVRGKGGKVRRRALPPQVGVAVDAYLAHRAELAGVTVDELVGPLFATRTGGRLDQPAIFLLLRRLARVAEIASWHEISPHSLRHAWNTIAREAGADLDSRQDALAHADPRTTRRYDRSAHRLDRDPAYLVAAATAGRA